MSLLLLKVKNVETTWSKIFKPLKKNNTLYLLTLYSSSSQTTKEKSQQMQVPLQFLFNFVIAFHKTSR